MNQLLWLLRAKRWVQRPPSARRVALVLGVAAACLLVAGLDGVFGWPEALTPDRLRQGP